jgi:hypothetical protein
MIDLKSVDSTLEAKVSEVGSGVGGLTAETSWQQTRFWPRIETKILGVGLKTTNAGS